MIANEITVVQAESDTLIVSQALQIAVSAIKIQLPCLPMI